MFALYPRPRSGHLNVIDGVRSQIGQKSPARFRRSGGWPLRRLLGCGTHQVLPFPAFGVLSKPLGRWTMVVSEGDRRGSDACCPDHFRVDR